MLSMSIIEVTPVPEHVAEGVVLPYDFLGGPEVNAFPPTAVNDLRSSRRVFYTPLYGGAWIFTRYADIRQLFQDHEHLVPNVLGVPPTRTAQNKIPLNLNPPEHTVW